MLNYRSLILDSLYKAELIDDELYEKCQPSYISGLPGNLYSTDANVLQSRLDAIDEKVEEFNEKIEEELEKRNELDENTKMHEENIKYYNKQINDYLRKEREFEDLNSRLQNEALDTCQELRDDWNELMEQNTTNIQPSKSLEIEMNVLGMNEFEFTGVMSEGEASYMKLIAQRVEDYFSSVNDDVNTWQTQGITIADDIRLLADKHNVNNRSNGWVEARDEVSNLDFIPQMRRNIQESENQIKKNNEESEKIDRKIERYNTAINNLDDNYTKTENRKTKVEEQE